MMDKKEKFDFDDNPVAEYLNRLIKEDQEEIERKEMAVKEAKKKTRISQLKTFLELLAGIVGLVTILKECI